MPGFFPSFMMPKQAVPQPKKLLTIGGSDSGGAAGIQADLKTWTALAVYGMSAITAVTAQNSLEVKAAQYLPPHLLSAQIDAVLSDYGADAVKTGFIGRSDLITVIGQTLQAHRPPFIIIDPVLVNHKKQTMFPEEVTMAYCDQLLPLATLITPNWAEALVLGSLPAHMEPTPKNRDLVLQILHDISHSAILITGLEHDDLILDIYYGNGEKHAFARSPIETANRHGSGDTLSAAIAAYLSQGCTMLDAIQKAQKYTVAAIEAAMNWQLGQGHGPLSHFGSHLDGS